MKALTTLAATVLLAASTAQANDFAPAMQAYYDDQIAAWANDPMLVAAIQEQNGRTGALSQAEIDALDGAWRAEVGTAATPTITPVMDNPAAAFLRDRVAASGGVITEVFVMDARGLNVAASDVTSDDWQGDEDKHSMTYGVGAGAIHLSDIEFDESSQTYQGQISVSIVDPASGAVIGAITVGVNADALM